MSSFLKIPLSSDLSSKLELIPEVTDTAVSNLCGRLLSYHLEQLDFKKVSATNAGNQILELSSRAGDTRVVALYLENTYNIYYGGYQDLHRIIYEKIDLEMSKFNMEVQEAMTKVLKFRQ